MSIAKNIDLEFESWLAEKDTKGVSRYEQCTAYLTDSEKDYARALMRLAFISGYVRGTGLLGGESGGRHAKAT
jgi:hypothetical protein